MSPQIDYDALARRYGATSSSAGTDYDALAKQYGATSSVIPPDRPGPPGFFTRLGQSVGIPTSREELKAAQPSTIEKIYPPATAAKMLWNYGKTVARGVGQGAQEISEAGRNIAEGGPVLPNLAKGAYGGVHAGLQAIPFLGPPIETAGEDVTAGNVAGAAGGLTGVVGQIAAPYALEKGGVAVRRLKAPLGETVTTPRGTIPAEAHTPEQLKAYADQHGIPLTAAQATEHNLPRNIQSAGERASVGGTAIKRQIVASQAAVAQHTENLMNSFSPNTQDVATAGDTIQKNVRTALDQAQTRARQDYAAIDRQAGGVQVDLKPLKQTASRVLADSDFVRKVGSLDPKRGTGILQGISKLPDAATFEQAQRLRSALLDASRLPELAISDQAQGWLKQLTGSVDGEMMNAARSKVNLRANVTNLEAHFRAANERWTQLQEDFNNPRSPLAQILQEPDPSRVPQKLTQRGQVGGSPYNARLLDRYGIDKGPVKWAILNDIAGKDFRLYNKTLAGYSDEFLRSVFTRQELNHLYKTGAIARSVGVNTNPSGTAAVSGAMQDVSSPLRSLTPKAAAARATKSPRFNRWMMRPAVPQRPGLNLPFLRVPRQGAEDQQ